MMLCLSNRLLTRAARGGIARGPLADFRRDDNYLLSVQPVAVLTPTAASRRKALSTNRASIGHATARAVGGAECRDVQGDVSRGRGRHPIC